MPQIVVVGAGLAGLRAAQELRRQGFDGAITVVGAERHRPYDRPPLSKGLLLGKVTAADIGLLPAEQEAELDVDWRLGRTIAAIGDGMVTLEDGERLTADGIVLASGARPRELPLGADLAGVQTLRTIEDAQRLRAGLTAGARLTVIGAGLIGGEIAAGATALGADVTVVEVEPEPFSRLFDPSVAALLHATHLDAGVRLLTGTAVVGVAGTGRVESVELADGRRIDTDLLLIGVGAVPNVEFLGGSGIACDGGVLTDEFGRTSVRGIVAAGDVAHYRSPAGHRIRYEHWTNARDMPPVAVAALLAQLNGRPDPATPYDPVPYYWSDQYGHHIQVAGIVRPDDETRLVEGRLEDASFVLEHTRGGISTAVVAWDSPRTFNRLRRQLRRPA
jgi:NADPH-dependent 2,4-dienoyl-CoA reductase/sulfur reductase-like enzyme